MGSAAGVMKTAAARVGVTVEGYEARAAAGLRWCCGCKEWHQTAAFATDLSRTGGLGRTCRAWRVANLARTSEPVEKRRARRVVQMRVRRGQLPRPGSLPCAKCGKTASGTGKRHEYHHHNGYSPGHQADVIPLCSTCHSCEEK